MPQELPSEIRILIDTALNAFSNRNQDIFINTFGGDVVIIDGFAPFRWTGPNAQSRWWSDAEKWGHEFGVRGENISPKEIMHWQVAGTHGYVVISAMLTITLSKGEPINRSGILTYTLAKLGDEWKVQSQAWGRLN